MPPSGEVDSAFVVIAGLSVRCWQGWLNDQISQWTSALEVVGSRRERFLLLFAFAYCRRR